jgi:hypothetical protein
LLEGRNSTRLLLLVQFLLLRAHPFADSLKAGLGLWAGTGGKRGGGSDSLSLFPPHLRMLPLHPRPSFLLSFLPPFKPRGWSYWPLIGFRHQKVWWKKFLKNCTIKKCEFFADYGIISE